MDYLFLFLSGLLGANGIPHFVNGISGRSFPSPFARPPGKGLSSPLINVLWGIFNFVLAFFCYAATDGFSWGAEAGCVLFFAGVLLSSVGLAILFEKADKE